MWTVAAVVDSADMEYSHHHRKFCRRCWSRVYFAIFAPLHCAWALIISHLNCRRSPWLTSFYFLTPVHSLLWSNDFQKTLFSLWESLRYKAEKQSSGVLMIFPSLNPSLPFPFHLLAEQLLSLQDRIPVFPTQGKEKCYFFYTLTLLVQTTFGSMFHIVTFG